MLSTQTSTPAATCIITNSATTTFPTTTRAKYISSCTKATRSVTTTAATSTAATTIAAVSKATRVASTTTTAASTATTYTEVPDTKRKDCCSRICCCGCCKSCRRKGKILFYTQMERDSSSGEQPEEEQDEQDEQDEELSEFSIEKSLRGYGSTSRTPFRATKSDTGLGRPKFKPKPRIYSKNYFDENTLYGNL